MDEVIYDPTYVVVFPTVPPVGNRTFYFMPKRFVSLYEKITPNSTGRSREWKSFEHFKSVTAPITGGGLQQPEHYINNWTYGWPDYYTGVHHDPFWIYDETRYGEAGMPDAGLPAFDVPSADGTFIPPPANLSALQQRGLNHMMPYIKAELSLINTLIELKDFSSLPRTISNIATTAKSIITRGSQTLRRLLHAGSDSYLQTQFNILPLLSDISGIHAALARTEKRLNDLVARQGRVQTKHFQFVWQEYDNVDEDSEGFLWPKGVGPSTVCNSYRSNRQVIYAPTVFHSEIEYHFNFTQYQVEHARILGLLDAFGVQVNPAIIWNAIPWSFVVDWVFGVSRWLDQFRYLNMEPLINIRRYLWSVKRSRQILVSTKVANSNPWNQIAHLRWTVPTTYQSSYRRCVTMPSLSSLEMSGVSPKEVTLGAALVLPRRYRPRYKK